LALRPRADCNQHGIVGLGFEEHGSQNPRGESNILEPEPIALDFQAPRAAKKDPRAPVLGIPGARPFRQLSRAFFQHMSRRKAEQPQVFGLLHFRPRVRFEITKHALSKPITWERPAWPAAIRSGETGSLRQKNQRSPDASRD